MGTSVSRPPWKTGRACTRSQSGMQSLDIDPVSIMGCIMYHVQYTKRNDAMARVGRQGTVHHNPQVLSYGGGTVQIPRPHVRTSHISHGRFACRSTCRVAGEAGEEGQARQLSRSPDGFQELETQVLSSRNVAG